jgi:hypothetical protein
VPVQGIACMGLCALRDMPASAFECSAPPLPSKPILDFQVAPHIFCQHRMTWHQIKSNIILKNSIYIKQEQDRGSTTSSKRGEPHLLHISPQQAILELDGLALGGGADDTCCSRSVSPPPGGGWSSSALMRECHSRLSCCSSPSRSTKRGDDATRWEQQACCLHDVGMCMCVHV